MRLLAVGLPLTIALGWALAAWCFPQLGMWLALLVGAALAPTDAALGVPVVTNPTVPSRIRQLITVESGLNDGIATPVVMLAIAGSAAAAGLEHAEGAGQGGRVRGAVSRADEGVEVPEGVEQHGPHEGTGIAAHDVEHGAAQEGHPDLEDGGPDRRAERDVQRVDQPRRSGS